MDFSSDSHSDTGDNSSSSVSDDSSVNPVSSWDDEHDPYTGGGDASVPERWDKPRRRRKRHKAQARATAGLYPPQRKGKPQRRQRKRYYYPTSANDFAPRRSPLLPVLPTDPDETICVLRAPQYVLAGSIGLTHKHMVMGLLTFDTGAGCNIIRANVLPYGWEDYLLGDVPMPNLGDANGNRLNLLGAVALRMRFKNNIYKSTFFVARRLAVPAIVGTSFMNRHVDAIRPRRQVVQFYKGPTLSILAQGNSTSLPYRDDLSGIRSDDCSDVTDDEGPQKVPKDTKDKGPIGLRRSVPVKLAKFVTLRPMEQMSVKVQTPASGLVLIEPRDSLMQNSRVSAANGVADVLPNQAFKILLANFSPHTVRLQKNQIVAHATRASASIKHLHIPQMETLSSILNIPEDILSASSRSGSSTTSVTPQSVTGKSRLPTGPDSEILPSDAPASRVAPVPPDAHYHKLARGRASSQKGGDSTATRLGLKVEEPEPEPSWAKVIELSHVAEYKTAILEMLMKHEHMWTPGRLGEISATEHRIELAEGSKPLRQAPYRQGLARRKLTEEAVKEMLHAGVIEPASTEWASPVVLVPKPDGTQRFCVDYRKLNAITVPDSYPLPRADDCLDSLGEAMIFTTLDCNSGYWQIPIAECDRDKTTFTTHMGTFRHLRMPFGLRNAPATFQRALDIILSSVRWQSCLIYLDDVIVFSKNVEQHLKDVDVVLKLLGKAGVSLKLKKCEFFQPKVNYLGHVVTPGKLSIALNRLDGFENAAFPLDKSQLRSFLGAANYYRRFVRGFAALARPLNDMLKKGEPDLLPAPNEEQLASFNAIKGALLSPPVLALPRAGRKVMLDTDASAYQLGVALLQAKEQVPDEWEPIGFFSKTLNDAERNYSATERECYAVVWGVTTLRPYVEGQSFTVRTDHDALKWLMNLEDPSGRLARWRLRLAEFDLRITYRPGRVHQVPDALSRLPRIDPTVNSAPVDDEIPGIDELILVTTRSRVRHTTPDVARSAEAPTPEPGMGNADEEEVAPEQAPQSGKKIIFPTPSPCESGRCNHPHHKGRVAEDLADANHVTHFNMEIDDMFIDYDPGLVRKTATEFDALPAALTVEEIIREQRTDDFCQTVLARQHKDSHFFEDEAGVLRKRLPFSPEYAPVVLPTVLQPRALNIMHYAPAAGHPGQTRMYTTMRRLFYWPHMSADIFAIVRDCPSCSRERLKQRKRQEPLQLFQPTGPLEDVALDLLGPFPKTKQGYQSILVITDRFSKLCQAIPMKTTDAMDCALAFVNHWIYKYGSPARLISDNGPQFVARFFQSVCRILGVRNVFTTAYHPETNGQTERYNRSLLAMLRHYVSEHQDDWDYFTPTLTFAYNMTVHRSTGTTPFELVLSRPPPPFAIQRMPVTEKATRRKKLDLRDEFIDRLTNAVESANERLSAAQERYKTDFDKRIKHRLPELKEGDWVWLDRKELPPNSSKLTPPADKVQHRVVSASKGTVVIKRFGLIERVNRARVELAPPPENVQARMDNTDPTADDLAEKTTGQEWVVQRIKQHDRDFDGRLWFLVEWHGDWDDSWQPRKDLPEELISRYFDSQRKKAKRTAERSARGRAQAKKGGVSKAHRLAASAEA